MGRPATSLRLFVALYPPADAARAMVDDLVGLDLPPHRATPVELVHVTMLFIGETDGRQLEEVRESVARSVAGVEPFTLTPRRLVVLPERGPGRLVAVETDSPAGLVEIQTRLARRLARPGQRRREAFRPHLTVCRFREETWVERDRIERPCGAGAFLVGRVSLMRSVLRASGAEHVRVETLEIGPGGAS